MPKLTIHIHPELRKAIDEKVIPVVLDRTLKANKKLRKSTTFRGMRWYYPDGDMKVIHPEEAPEGLEDKDVVETETETYEHGISPEVLQDLKEAVSFDNAINSAKGLKTWLTLADWFKWNVVIATYAEVR